MPLTSAWRVASLPPSPTHNSDSTCNPRGSYISTCTGEGGECIVDDAATLHAIIISLVAGFGVTLSTTNVAFPTARESVRSLHCGSNENDIGFGSLSSERQFGFDA